jgi:hypothetical protein
MHLCLLSEGWFPEPTYQFSVTLVGFYLNQTGDGRGVTGTGRFPVTLPDSSLDWAKDRDVILFESTQESRLILSAPLVSSALRKNWF